VPYSYRVTKPGTTPKKPKITKDKAKALLEQASKTTTSPAKPAEGAAAAAANKPNGSGPSQPHKTRHQLAHPKGVPFIPERRGGKVRRI
jgi:hypothetical protein